MQQTGAVNFSEGPKARASGWFLAENDAGFTSSPANVGQDKDSDQRQWLAKHPRFHLHFTPTSTSWLFSEITGKRIYRGTFKSVADLKDAINDYLDRHNADPKSFVWTKSAEVILERARHALDVLAAIKTGNQPLDSER